jgi:hypothetical protein
MNFLAFYLGAIYLERSGILCGVAIFLFTALAGTIIASGLERFVISQTGKAFNVCVDRIARHSAERLYIGRR